MFRNKKKHGYNKIYRNEKRIIANILFQRKKQEKHENRSTTPLLALKTLTSVRASQEMAVNRTTTVAGVKPCNKGRNISDETSAGGRDWCRGASSNGGNNGGGTWNSNDDQRVVVTCLGNSYDRSIFLRPSGKCLRIGGTGVGSGSGGGGDRDGS